MDNRWGERILQPGISVALFMGYMFRSVNLTCNKFVDGFHPEIPKQCFSAMGWGFHGVSRTALWQDGDSKKICLKPAGCLIRGKGGDRLREASGKFQPLSKLSG